MFFKCSKKTKVLLVYYKRRTLSMGLWNQVDFELEFQLEVYKLLFLQQAIQHWQWPKCKPFNFICHILVSQKKSIRKIAWNITLSLNIWCECFVLYLVNFYSHFYCACFSHFFSCVFFCYHQFKMFVGEFGILGSIFFMWSIS